MLALHHTPFRIGAPGETRTHNPLLKRQVPWSSLATDALYVGGTERTRTVISLIDNQVPHPSATVPCEFGWVEGT